MMTAVELWLAVKACGLSCTNQPPFDSRLQSSPMGELSSPSVPSAFLPPTRAANIWAHNFDRPPVPAAIQSPIAQSSSRALSFFNNPTQPTRMVPPHKATSPSARSPQTQSVATIIPPPPSQEPAPLDPEPMVNYYSIKNGPAAAEDTERAAPVICEFTRGKGYEAFAVGIVHA